MNNKEYKSNGLMAFANRFKELRQSLNLSQKSMANQLGYTNAHICELEAYKTKPSYEFLVIVEEKYNVNLGWLIQGNGSMFLNTSETPKPTPSPKPHNPDDDVQRFLYYFNHSPVFKYNVLGFALKFLRESQGLIDQDVDIYLTESQEVTQHDQHAEANRDGSKQKQT